MDNTALALKGGVWSVQGWILVKLERLPIVLMKFQARRGDVSRPDEGLGSLIRLRAAERLVHTDPC
jgi:hypothetical protein